MSFMHVSGLDGGRKLEYSGGKLPIRRGSIMSGHENNHSATTCGH